jgi:hypothetical protein
LFVVKAGTKLSSVQLESKTVFLIYFDKIYHKRGEIKMSYFFIPQWAHKKFNVIFRVIPQFLQTSVTLLHGLLIYFANDVFR